MIEFLIALIIFAIFALPSILAHLFKRNPHLTFLRIILYALYVIYLYVHCLAGFGFAMKMNPDSLNGLLLLPADLLIFCVLFRPVRKLLSRMLTPLDALVSGDLLKARRKSKAAEISGGDQSVVKDGTQSIATRQILIPESIPHLNGLFLYLLILTLSLIVIDPSKFLNPALSHAPTLHSLDPAFAFSFGSTLIIILCGIGIFITRKPQEVLSRLALVKPGKKELAIGLAMTFFTFFYDYVWSLFTHAPQHHSAYLGVMSKFNTGTYLADGSWQSALIMALVIGICAGVEEEITIRGALQPVLGILPAAFLHAVMHLQFNAAPLFIAQIFVWSALMGILKHYTNTTTTIIAHGMFNFISCFLIGFNP